MSLSRVADQGTMVPPPLSQIVKEHILQNILAGALKPGDRIIETRIANEIRTSQAPVREAIRELETLGVLESSRNRGARVRSYDPQQMQEIYEVRAELESYAIRLILDRGTLDRRTLDAAIEAMGRAAAQDHLMTFAEHNAAFHRALVSQSGNVALLEMWELLDIKSRTFLNISQERGDLFLVTESHRPIVEALSAADRTQAEARIREHVLSNSPMLRDGRRGS